MISFAPCSQLLCFLQQTLVQLVDLITFLCLCNWWMCEFCVAKWLAILGNTCSTFCQNEPAPQWTALSQMLVFLISIFILTSGAWIIYWYDNHAHSDENGQEDFQTARKRIQTVSITINFVQSAVILPLKCLRCFFFLLLYRLWKDVTISLK